MKGHTGHHLFKTRSVRAALTLAISCFRPSKYFCFICALLVLPSFPLLADDKEKFPDEVEKPLAELEKKAVDLRSSAQMEEMKKSIDEIATAAKLGDDVKKKLEAEAKTVVERSLEPWKDKLDSRLRPFLRQNVKESLELMAEWPAEMLIKSGFVPEPAKLSEQDDWKNALKKVLGPEQLTALENQAKEREQGKEKEIREHLKPHLEQIKKNLEMTFKAEAADAKTALSLTGDRAKKMDDMAADFAKRGYDAVEKRMTEEMRKMPDEMRAQVLLQDGVQQGRMQLTATGMESESPPDMEEWRKALRETLSEDERKLWETASHSRQTRQDKAMAMMLVSYVDNAALLTAAQREKLEPLAEKVMATISKSERENFSGNMDFFSKFKLEDLKPILDEKQIEHWKEGPTAMRRGYRNGVEVEDKSEPEVASNDADLDEDTIFANYFHGRDQAQRDRLAQGLRVKLEDVQRVVKPSEESIKRLELAARGAAEHALDNWRPNFENWVRSSVRNVSAKTLKQRLASLSKDVSFGDPGASNDQPIWSNAVSDVLTESQKELWMNEVNGRKSYKERARALMILADTDRRYHLSLDQYQKLEPLLTEAIAEYATDFNRMFSGGGGDMPRYMIVLLAGVPEDKLKSILTPEQFEQWHQASEGQFKGWWENIKNSHDSRTRRAKQPR